MKESKIIDQREVLGKNFRVYGTAEEPLFLAKDVAEWIDYAKTGKGSYDVSRMLNTVDEDEYLVRKVFVSGQRRDMKFLTEDGLYEVLMQSTKPIAKQFKKKVKEILKSIRQNGMYAKDELLDNPDLLFEVVIKLREERQARLKAENTINILTHVNKTYTTTEIAKEIGMKSAIELNNALKLHKIQYKQNNTWVLYSDYSSLGYEDIKQEVLDNGKVIYHRRWTQRGREFILNYFQSQVC